MYQECPVLLSCLLLYIFCNCTSLSTFDLCFTFLCISFHCSVRFGTFCASLSFFIIDALSLYIYRVNEDSNNNIKAKKRVERRNSRALEPVGKLKPPTISDVGQFFDVHVTLSAHPGHFIVQPLHDTNELKVRTKAYIFRLC